MNFILVMEGIAIIKLSLRHISPYSNRDPRFALSIYTNGSSFKNTTIETFEGGAHKRIKNGTMTGYYLRKFVDSNIDLMVNGTSNHPWVIFRISEIYSVSYTHLDVYKRQISRSGKLIEKGFKEILSRLATRWIGLGFLERLELDSRKI